LGDVVGALQGTGVTAANLIGLNGSGSSTGATTTTNSSSYADVGSLTWYFTLTVPMANLKGAIGTLSAVQASVAKLNNGLSVGFNVSGTSVSTQAQACSLSDLISDARTQAQKVASASNASAGSIVGMQSNLTNGGPTNGVCSLTVKFSLGAF
jgi:hypothetical protein